jgi:hypothetical protein
LRHHDRSTNSPACPPTHIQNTGTKKETQNQSTAHRSAGMKWIVLTEKAANGVQRPFHSTDKDMSTSTTSPRHRTGVHSPHAHAVLGILPSRGCHDGNAYENSSGKDPLAEELDELAEKAAAQSKDSGKLINTQKKSVITVKKR